jgi:autotransporter strand-loop-strand O-heptosyltransferase
MKFKISYKTTSPLQDGAPIVYCYPEQNDSDYTVYFKDLQTGDIFETPITPETKYISSGRQWFTYWEVIIKDSNGTVVLYDKFDPTNKVVFIKSDAKALGDNLAWMPYIEEFRIKNNCIVVCSTFFNELFINSYPNILFVEPNIQIQNVYAQYYIGTHNTLNICYQPSLYLNNPLQKIACDILGLTYSEIKPNIGITLNIPKKKQITLSERASLKVKEWNVVGGWQAIVDLFVKYGYEVIVISKEYSYLKNVTNKSGDRPLQERIYDIATSKYHVGLSSGLSWLAWAANTHTFLISDFTPPNHEFQSNSTRIYNKESIRSSISYEEILNPVSIQDTLEIIESYLIKFDN